MSLNDPQVLTLDDEEESEMDSEDERLLAAHPPPPRPRPATTTTRTNPRPAPSKRPRTAPPGAGSALSNRQLAAEVRRAAQEATRRARVARAFASHARSGACRRDEIELVVAPALHADTSTKDVLRQVRPLFGEQLHAEDLGVANLITWRRRSVAGATLADGEARASGFSLVVIPGDQFLERYEHNVLDKYAKFIAGKRAEDKVIFAVPGVEREVKKRANAFLRHDGEGDGIVSMRELQSVYTHLYMKYGIRTRDCATEKEVAKYVLELTDAIAGLPYHQESDFLAAAVRYRDARRHVSHRTTVIASRPAPESQLDGEEDDEYGMDIDGDGLEVGSRIGGDGEGSGGVMFARPEGSGDLGYMYVAMLCQIPGLSLNRASAIRERYPTFADLFCAYKLCGNEKERELLLADVRYNNGRRIGPQLSKVVASAFTSMDPETAVDK